MIRTQFKERLDDFYRRVHINDFSSFIKSDFRDDMLFDLSPERADKNKAQCRELLAQMAQWRRDGALTPEEAVILNVVEDFCRYIVRNSDFYWYKFNLTHNTTPLPYVIKRLETYPLPDGEALSLYMKLLNQFPEKLAGLLHKLQRQRELGIILPREQCDICLNLLQSLMQDEHSLLLPHNRAEIDLRVIGYTDEAAQTLRQVLAQTNRALQGIADYIGGAYLSGTVDALPGLCHVRGGQQYYRALIQTYTSYELAPELIHQIGLTALAETTAKMQGIIAELGLDMDIKEFEQYLKRERICFDDTVQALQARFDKTLAQIKPRMDECFRRQPQAGCRCDALPASREGATSWGYYSVPIGTEAEGVFYYSAAELDRRTQIRTAAIVAHELLPGHHYQTNLIMEDQSLPDICRHHFNTAFADGWAEYAADLAYDMGVYDLYELYGRYVWDMVLCCRLVVDTGLNALGWSIEQAREFMRRHTYLTEREIFTETLRYAVDMPGQALAYKFGSIKMHEFRRKAEAALGTSFDIRDYHEEVLRYGSMPLNLLEQVVEAYIERRK